MGLQNHAKGEIMSEDMMDQLAAALNGRELTDNDGEVSEERETLEGNTADPEQETTEEDTATGENQDDSTDEGSRPDDDDDESQLAEDESGKKYVPEKRFKDIYAKLKQKEREINELNQRSQRGQQILDQIQSKSKSKTSKPVEKSQAELKVEALELKMELPQFDPNNEGYSQELDDLGYEIYRANPGMTMVEAGRRAIEYSSKLAQREVKARESARQVKSLQSDQGITSRVTTRQTEKSPDDMSLEEMESYLKDNGAWN